MQTQLNRLTTALSCLLIASCGIDNVSVLVPFRVHQQDAKAILTIRSTK